MEKEKSFLLNGQQADVESDSKKDYSESDRIAIREECRKMLEQRFLKPPPEEMMKALFDAILEDMVIKEMS